MIGRRHKTPPHTVDKPKWFDDFDMRLGDLMRGERATLAKSLLDVQRELKIKATYIAAIENADVSAFESPGFIAGYVRSYARYLGMEPDWAFEKFCRESGFSVAHGMSAAASSASVAAVRTRQNEREGRDSLGYPNMAFVPPSDGIWSRIEPGAIGSLAVLVALTSALAYGGWSVLQEVQRVRLAPIDQAPLVVAEIDPLGDVDANASIVRSSTEGDILVVASSQNSSAERLYQPDALEVPVLTARDGPISAIDPEAATGLASDAGAISAVLQSDIDDLVQVVAESTAGVEVLAVRPSWVRISAADGTVLFEKILDAGERYAVPNLEEVATLRAGNSGSIYFVVNGQTFGPASPGSEVVRNVALSAEALTATYAVADLSGDADLAQFVTVADASLPLTGSGETAPSE